MAQCSDQCVWSTFISFFVQDFTFMFSLFRYFLSLCTLDCYEKADPTCCDGCSYDRVATKPKRSEENFTMIWLACRFGGLKK